MGEKVTFKGLFSQQDTWVNLRLLTSNTVLLDLGYRYRYRYRS